MSARFFGAATGVILIPSGINIAGDVRCSRASLRVVLSIASEEQRILVYALGRS